MLAVRTLQRLLVAGCALFALAAAAVPQAAFCGHLPDYSSRPASRPMPASESDVRPAARELATEERDAPPPRVAGPSPAKSQSWVASPPSSPPAAVEGRQPIARGPPRCA